MKTKNTKKAKAAHSKPSKATKPAPKASKAKAAAKATKPEMKTKVVAKIAAKPAAKAEKPAAKGAKPTVGIKAGASKAPAAAKKIGPKSVAKPAAKPVAVSKAPSKLAMDKAHAERLEKAARSRERLSKLPPLVLSKPVIGSVVPPAKVVPKKKAPALPSSDVAKLRVLLMAQKRRLSGTVSGMRSEALEKDEAVSHDSIADHGTDVFDQDITLKLVENEQMMIQSIDEALVKIADGLYGKCENCAENIRKERLEALPFARLCMDCQEAQESGRG